MALDPVTNFGITAVSTTYDAAALEIILSAGGGAKLPDPVVDGAYNLTWWNSTDYASASQDPNKEIIRVTGPAGTGNTKTILRAQEGTSASTKNTAGKTYSVTLSQTKIVHDEIKTAVDRVDQDVTNGSAPTFVGTNITAIPASNVEINEIGNATYDDVQDWLNSIQSAGIIDGFELDNSRTALELDVLAGKGYIKSADSEIASTLPFDFAGQQNITLTTDRANYIYLDYNSGTPQILATVDRSLIELNRQFTLGAVYKNGTDLHIVNGGVHVSNLARTEHERLIARDGFTHISGSVTSEIGTLNLNITEGKWDRGHNPINTDALNTSITGSWRYTHYGVASWIIDNATAATVDCTHYNSGADLITPLTVNAYGTQWVYISADSSVYVIYGTENGTLAAAQAATPPTNIPEYMSTLGELIAKIIVRQDGTISSIGITHGIIFSSSGVPNHNDTGNLNADNFKHLTEAEKTLFDTVEANAAADQTASEVPNTPAGSITSTDVQAALNELDSSKLTAAVSSPTLGDIIKFNGTQWVNDVLSTINGGAGISFYLDETKIIIAGSGPQTIPLESLLKDPTIGTESAETAICNNNTVMIDQYMYNTELGTTSIPSGQWGFDTFCDVDDATAISEVITTLGIVTVGTGTITITGTGTSRTATVSSATPFVSSDYNVDPLLSGRIITPNGIFLITGYTSSTVVTIETLTNYTNESAVSYSIEYYQFQVTTGNIDETSAVLKEVQTIQDSITIVDTDKLTVRYYGKTTHTSNVTISLFHNGSEHYTHFTTPIAILHNDLPEIQGGSATERYHLSLAEYNVVGNTSGLNTGDQLASEVPIVDAGSIIAATDVEGALQENRTAIDLNTAKVTNATHTGEVTGSSALTIDKTAISGKSTVTAVGTDYILIGDTSDTDNLKKALVSDMGGRTTITSESFSSAVSHLTTDADAGKTFTITSFPAHCQITAIRIRADWTAGQQVNVGSALVNNASGILPGGTIIAYDAAVADFAVNDYIYVDDECFSVSADSGTALTVAGGKKGTQQAFHDDNATIVKANHGVRLVLFKDTNRNYSERIIELSSIMTYKGVTDAAITAADDYFGLTADIQNVGHNDFIVIEDTANEICRVQNVNHDTVSATYDYTIFVQDDLAAHNITKDVKKLMVYDLDTPYDSGTTLYGTVFIDEKITATVNVEVEVFTDSYT